VEAVEAKQEEEAARQKVHYTNTDPKTCHYKRRHDADTEAPLCEHERNCCLQQEKEKSERAAAKKEAGEEDKDDEADTESKDEKEVAPEGNGDDSNDSTKSNNHTSPSLSTHLPLSSLAWPSIPAKSPRPTKVAAPRSSFGRRRCRR
jgi:hypothetical protein